MKKLSVLPIACLVFLSKMIPFNVIVGSYHLTFSCTSMMAPVIASQFGLSWLSLFFLSSKLLTTKSIFLTLVHRMPLVFAAFAYRTRHWSISILLPVVCMGLFCAHDVGSVAWVYSLYWLIPIGLYFAPSTMITRALSSSFVAHAVGSVIWLYTTEIAASLWIALIPIVVCERLLIAAGIVGLDVAITKVRNTKKIQTLLQTAGLA